MLTTIAKPFGWLMMRLYEFTGNYGLAVILFALIVKLILLPFQLKSKRSMMQQQRLQPQIQKLQKKHAGNQQKLNEEIQKLYREEGVKPLSGCFWSFIPFPILIALYQAIRYPLTIMMGIADAAREAGGVIAGFLEQTGFTTNISSAYIQIGETQWLSARAAEFKTFVANNTNLVSTGVEKFQEINFSFLGLDLGAQPGVKWIIDGSSWTSPDVWWPLLGLFLIPVFAAALTFLSSRINSKQQQQDPSAKSMKLMTYLMPLMTLYFAFIVPGALGLYWIASSAFAIIQDLILNRMYAKKFAAEDAEFNARMAEREKRLEEKRQETEQLRAMNATERNENTSAKKKRAAERQVSMEKAREYEKKKGNITEDASPSRVGERRYARGRAYDPERFAAGAEAAAAADEEPELSAEDVEDDVPETVSAPAPVEPDEPIDEVPDEEPVDEQEEPDNEPEEPDDVDEEEKDDD